MKGVGESTLSSSVGTRELVPATPPLLDSWKTRPGRCRLHGVGDHSTVVPVEQVGTDQMAENQPN